MRRKLRNSNHCSKKISLPVGLFMNGSSLIARLEIFYLVGLIEAVRGGFAVNRPPHNYEFAGSSRAPETVIEYS